jgi:hypothetical protein
MEFLSTNLGRNESKLLSERHSRATQILGLESTMQFLTSLYYRLQMVFHASFFSFLTTFRSEIRIYFHAQMT